MLNPSPRQTFGSGNEWGNSKVIAWSVLLRWLTFHLKTESCEILARFLRNLREGAVPLPTLQKAVKSPMFFSLLWEAPAGRDLPEAKGRCLHLRSEAVVMALLQLQTTKPPPPCLSAFAMWGWRAERKEIEGEPMNGSGLRRSYS